jgi:ABC-2 type transport system permease protein
MSLVKTVKLFSKSYKNLLLEMIRTDFKLRYQGSVLGYLWSLLKPLFLFVILYTVFTRFLHIGRGIPNWPVSLLLGIVLWNFFVDATSGALKSIVAKGSLIRKVNIPRYMIPIASISSAFINLLLNLAVVFIFVLVAHDTALGWSALLYFPLLILELVLVVVAVSFFLAAAYVRFRDIEHIWDVARQALFYSVPIIYPLEYIVSDKIPQLIILNPLAQIIQQSRSVITHESTPTLSNLYTSPFVWLIPLGAVALALWVGISYFRRHAPYFAEDI